MNGEDQDQQKANIFSPTGTDQGMQQAAGMNQQGAPQKTSTEGELGSTGDAGNGQPATQPAAPADQQGSQDAARQALQRNAGKTQNPDLFNKAQAEIGTADKGLQDEANSYTAAAKGTNYGVSDADLDSFVKGDQGAAEKVTKLNSTGAVAADPFHTKQDLSLYDVDQLQSDAGLVNAYRNQGGADYSAGMGAFDLASARRTPGFDALRASLAQQKSDLQKRADEYGTSKTAEAQAAMDANLGTAKTGLKTGLEKRSADMLALDKAAADKANLTAHQGDKNFITAKSTAAREALAAGADPGARLNTQLLTSGIDPAKFYAMKDAVAKDMVSPEQAAQFNRIMSALGKSDPDSVYTAGSGAPSQTFDEKAYRDAVYKDAVKRRGVADAGLQKQIDDLTSGYQKQYDPAAEKAAEMAAVQNDLRGQYGDIFDQVDSNGDAYGTGANWQDMLSAADVAKLSPLYKQLGAASSMPQVGRFAGGAGAFDADAYRAALSQSLAAKQQSIQDEKDAQAAAAEKADIQSRPLSHTGYYAKKSRGAEDAINRPIEKAANNWDPTHGVKAGDAAEGWRKATDPTKWRI